jgi:uncharacterized membrane protein
MDVNDVKKIIGLAFVAMIIDLPWISMQGSWLLPVIEDIQGGRPMATRLWGALPVYLALGYLTLQVNSAPNAFLAGIATYVVYDFTQVATFDKYPTWFACVDSLWGGFLMLLVWWVGSRVGLVVA